MPPETSLCHWRKLWRTTSESNGTTARPVVAEKLNLAKEQLEKGLVYYQAPTADALTKFSTQYEKCPEAVAFVKKLQQFIGLDVFQVWDLLQHYLSDRFHGTVNATSNRFPITDSTTNEYLLEIWTFYNSERSFMLKQLKLILEHGTNPEHAYVKEFDDIIKNISPTRLKESVIAQFKHVVEEIPPTKSQNGDLMTFEVQRSWMKRNLNEQLELLLSLLVLIDDSSLSVQEFKTLFAIFKSHNFGRQPVYYKYLDDTHVSVLNKIIYAEIAIFYKIITDSGRTDPSAVISSIKDDIESELVRLQHNEEHGALLLAWMLLLLEVPISEDIFISRYQHFGTKALQLHVFKFLYNMCMHSMFASNSRCGSIFRHSLYRLMCNMCDRFDGDGSMSLHPFIIELCGELLSSASIAKDFWQSFSHTEKQGIVSIWNTALEFFPYDFKSLSVLIRGLVQASKQSYENTMHEINNLPMYTEVYKPRITPVSNVNDEENVILTRNYYPYGNKSFIIKASTPAIILDRRNATLIHYRTSVSIWKVFSNEINTFIDSGLQYNCNITEHIEKIVFGIHALNSILKVDCVNTLDTLAKPCEAVFELLVKFSHSNMQYISLISACFELCIHLVPRFHNEIFNRLMNIRLLPHIDNTTLSEEQYARGETFNTALIGHFMANIEQVRGEYSLFTSYLDLAMEFMKCDYNKNVAYGIIFPALIFVLREVFPHMSEWHFNSIDEKQNLHFKCLSYIFNILNLSSERMQNPVDKLMNRCCLHSLLNIDNGMALMKMIAYGEKNIQYLMEEETNLIDGPGVKTIKMIQLSMAVLMQVLRQKHTIKDKTTLSPLEHIIYTQLKQKDTIRIIPIVTGYMNHVFNKNLPNIACSLLKRFALEPQLSLLVCLEMSPHQIRNMFLERLRDKSESNLLKTTILEFVAICVEKQPGLTEVFFKVSHVENESKIFSKEINDESTEGILTYMAEYLSVVKSDMNSLYSPLLSRIMSLFHALWKNNMQILVKDLRQNPNFWEYLCSPLFQDILTGVKAYAQIFNMIGIELFMREGKVDNNLQTALKKFFQFHDEYLINWVTHIFSIDNRNFNNESIDEIPEHLSLLTSWKNFMSIVIKFQPMTINDSSKYTLSNACLKALNRELKTTKDNRIIIILAETYAIYFSNWKDDCINEFLEFYEHIKILLVNTATSFDSLHRRAKYAILAISTLSLNMSRYDFSIEDDLSSQIFYSICSINNLQLDKLYINGNDTVNDDEHLSNDVTVALKLLEQAIYSLENDFRDLDHSFPMNNLINKLVVYSIDMIHKPDRLNQTLASLSCLTAFARKSSSNVLLYCNISQNLWLKFLPPKELLSNIESSAWQPSAWWKVYRLGIDFVTAVLEKHGNFFAQDAILFAGVQEDYLTESILLIRQSLDVDALDLVQSALSFIAELMKYQTIWKQEHYQSLINLMRSVCMCLHYCITLILRPRSISLLVENPRLPTEETENAGPSPKVVIILNKLLDLMHLSTVSLKAFSPNLLDLLTDPFIEISQWQPLMELQFGSPKLSPDPYPLLTFGTVMSAVCFLTRSLNYNYHAEEMPLNALKWNGGIIISTRRKYSRYEENTRRRSLRSDSVTSVSSTTSTSAINSNSLAALNKVLVLVTLENILTLLASQALLAIKDPKMPNKDKQVVRRELCAELPIFHEFVKKKIIDASHSKSNFSRKKHGMFPLLDEPKINDREKSSSSLAAEEDTMEYDENLFTPPPLPRKRISDSMRISVVRKLHLDKTKIVPKDNAKESHADLPGTSKSAESTSSDNQKQGGRSTKHVTWDESLSPQSDETPTDPEYSESCIISEVQMVEEDYLHFLSNVFLYICQTDN